ncbi:MAG: KpsF/GutQ family sugar-phosphate isomerase [Planctomycetota bacterium]|jgi:arabinose-5-phosphate isomerase
MSSVALKQSIPFSQFEQLRAAREIILQEAETLSALAGRLDTRFCDAVDLLRECPGRVIVSGIGKAGLIGQKIVATFSSMGTPAQFLHPSEAVHGDLGCVSDRDVVLILSNSGETEEIGRLTPLVRQLGAKIIALTNSSQNSLGIAADVVLEIGRLREAGVLALAPTTTTTAMLAMGDALALVVSQQKQFTARDFSVFHPGGSLGRRLTPVHEVMRRGDELRIADRSASIRETLQRLRKSGRRTGAILIVDEDGLLAGLFTDSDLARLLELHRDEQLDRPLAEVMTRGPLTIRETASLDDAVGLLTDRKISELPVIDEKGRPIGLIDITDVIGLVPNPAA